MTSANSDADADAGFTIIVVTYNSADVIGGLLDSLPAAVDHGPIETILVDNASSDGTADLVEARGDCTVVRSANTGYAGGINRGYLEARGRGPVLILNPDVVLKPGSAVRLAEALTQSATGIVAPRMFFPDGSLQHTLRRRPTLPRALGLSFTRLSVFSESCDRERDYETAHAVDWAIGAVMLIRRECFDVLGGWDDSFFLFSEEVDFCLRAWDAGWRTWFEPAAVAEHVGKHSGWDANLHAMESVNRVRLYSRRHSVVMAYLYWLVAIAREGVKALFGSVVHRRALVALLVPGRRPSQLPRSRRVLPR